MNSVNIIGRLTTDLELRRTQDGTSVCSYTLAVKRPKVKDATDFIECVTWRQGAEYLKQYGHKGDIVAVSGSLQSRKWTDKNGNNRTTWEVVAESVELLSIKRNSEAGGNASQAQNNSYAKPSYAQQNFQQLPETDADLPWEI